MGSFVHRLRAEDLDNVRRPRPPRSPGTSTSAPGAAATMDLLSLQRTIGNHAVVDLLARRPPAQVASSTIQRAILAIDGPSDDQAAKNITANCLATLQTVKSIDDGKGGKVPKKYNASDARGKTYGQDNIDSVFQATLAGVQNAGVKPAESIYVLGHGGGNLVAGLGPQAMASRLNVSMGPMAGGKWTGKLKLVACYSASLTEDGKQIKSGGQPIKEPYAAQLASELSSSRGAAQPSEVQGICGIAWVDEDTGKKTGFDVLGGALSPLEKVYMDRNLQPRWMAALQETDPAARKMAMDEILEEVQVKYPQFKGLDKRVTGKNARKKYTPNYIPPKSKGFFASFLEYFGLG